MPSDFQELKHDGVYFTAEQSRTYQTNESDAADGCWNSEERDVESRAVS